MIDCPCLENSDTFDKLSCNRGHNWDCVIIPPKILIIPFTHLLLTIRMSAWCEKSCLMWAKGLSYTLWTPWNRFIMLFMCVQKFIFFEVGSLASSSFPISSTCGFLWVSMPVLGACCEAQLLLEEGLILLWGTIPILGCDFVVRHNSNSKVCFCVCFCCKAHSYSRLCYGFDWKLCVFPLYEWYAWDYMYVTLLAI